MPITAEAVKAWLRLSDDADDAILGDVVAAVNAWTASIPAVADRDDPAAAWPVDVNQGAVMLAARMYRRRNTPSGVESMSDAIVYLPRRDSDVDQLLHIGAYLTPEVG